MLEWTQFELERYLEVEVDWDFIKEKELEKNPFSKEKKYRKLIAKKMLIQYAEALFRNSASNLGIYYNKATERIYKKYNKQFFKTTRIIGLISEDGLGKHEGSSLIKICKNIILPRPKDAERIILKIRKLSDEELGEVMMYIAGKEIKVQAVDKN